MRRTRDTHRGQDAHTEGIAPRSFKEDTGAHTEGRRHTHRAGGTHTDAIEEGRGYSERRIRRAEGMRHTQRAGHPLPSRRARGTQRGLEAHT